MKIALAALALSTSFATPVLAADVVNGSFETPTVTSPSYADGGTTVLVGGAGYEPNGGLFGYAVAPDGNQILHLQNGGSARLTLVDLIVGQQYLISLFTALRPNYGTAPITLAYNGTTRGAFTPTSTDFTRLSGFAFTAAGTTGTLSLTFGGGAGDLNAGVDAVSIAAVPEPATWAMMLIGFGMIGFGLRHRRKQTTRVAFA